MILVPDTIISIAKDDTIGGGNNIVAGATVNITKIGGGVASIYSDPLGASLISLPNATDSNGEFNFFIEKGKYNYIVDGVSRRVDVIGAVNDGDVVQSWASISSVIPSSAGQLFTLAQHTSGGLGGGTLMAFAGSVTDDGGTQKNCLSGFYLQRINYSVLDVTHFGALCDGITADDTAWVNAIAYGSSNGSCVYVPESELGTKITSTKHIDQSVPIIGLGGGGLLSQYLGRQGGSSRVLFTGSGACFQVNPNASPGSTVRLAYGQQFKNLIIQNATGNAAATHGIKVSDPSNINVAGMDIAGFTIDTVFIYGFKSGRGLEINYCFNNSISRLVVETCGVCCALNYAHGTSFFGGSLEQSLIGLDARSSYDVSLHGTTMQGINVARIASQGLSVPTDFFVWSSGWDGSGADGITRTVAADYAGSGVRVYGSQVRWFGGYEEGNTVGYLLELDSALELYSKYVDLDAPVTYWVQVGIGALTVHSPTFVQGAHAGLVGVIHTERNYAAPITVANPNFRVTVPSSKYYTGAATANAGMMQTWNPSTFRNTYNWYNSDLNINTGVVSHGGIRGLSGFDRDFRETLSPASTGTLTKDISSGTTGTNILHIADGATITVTFTDTARSVAGTQMRVLLINTGGSDTVVTFSTTYFRPASATYTLTTNTQRLFIFYFENGFWLESGAVLAL